MDTVSRAYRDSDVLPATRWDQKDALLDIAVTLRELRSGDTPPPSRCALRPGVPLIAFISRSVQRPAGPGEEETPRWCLWAPAAAGRRWAISQVLSGAQITALAIVAKGALGTVVITNAGKWRENPSYLKVF